MAGPKQGDREGRLQWSVMCGAWYAKPLSKTKQKGASKALFNIQGWVYLFVFVFFKKITVPLIIPQFPQLLNFAFHGGHMLSVKSYPKKTLQQSQLECKLVQFLWRAAGQVYQDHKSRYSGNLLLQLIPTNAVTRVCTAPVRGSLLQHCCAKGWK